MAVSHWIMVIGTKVTVVAHPDGERALIEARRRMKLPLHGPRRHHLPHGAVWRPATAHEVALWDAALAQRDELKGVKKKDLKTMMENQGALL